MLSELLTPALRIASDGEQALAPCAQAGGLTEVDLLAHARADVAAGVSDQRPADGSQRLAVVMHMLLGLVRVVPDHILLEAAGRCVVIDPADLGANDAFERMQHRAGPQALHRVATSAIARAG